MLNATYATNGPIRTNYANSVHIVEAKYVGRYIEAIPQILYYRLPAI